ncbi:MAG: hypothetical protein ACRDNK_16675 [Solirubrobacteraceae bacterium]
MSITAPTNGAIVGVHHVVVAGTVTPATAQVMVGGQPAQVSSGRFTRSLYLASPRQVVTVTAQAQGYVATQAATTINYSPNLAAQLVASSLGAPAKTPGTPGSKSTPATNNALNSALALPKSASSSGPSRSAPAHTTPTHTTPPHTAPTHTAPTHTTPTHTAPTHTTPPTPAPSPAPAPTPAPPSSGGSSPPVSSPPVLTVDRIKQLWDAGCLKHIKGENVVPYCTCLYTHLSARGTFKTRATVNALLKKLRAYGKSGDLNALPRAIRVALSVCSAKMPPLSPMGGPPTLTKLPGLSHKRVPFPVIAKLRPKS